MSSAAWREPGCHPVVDGVFRIPLDLPQDGLRAVNVYALETDAGLALIDGGWHRDDTHRELADALASIGRSPSEIHDVFVTHIHRDHYTFAVELRRRYGTRVHLGAAEGPGLAAIARLNNNVPEASLREARRAGAGELADAMYAATVDEPFDIADWEAPDSWLSGGVLDLPGHRIEAVETPGHTKGHLVFRDLDTPIAYTGDHILPTITPSIGFELGDWDLPLGKFLASLDLMVDDKRVIAPAHGEVGGVVGERARTLLDHHASRFAEIEEFFATEERATGLDVARYLPWTSRRVPFTALDSFNQLVAVCETMAHLDVLVAREAAHVHDRDGIDVFRI